MATLVKNRTDTKDDSKVPNWLKAELFVDILKDNITDFRAIKKFEAFAGTGAGENYATIMLRVEIEVELKDLKTKKTAFMIKLPHDTEMYRELLLKKNIFELERGMYLNVVPELEEIYRNIGLDVKFCAKAHLINAPDNYVLLEDLRLKGFRNADRLAGLDMKHTQSVLKKLAQWHAASALRIEFKGMYPPVYSEGFFNEEQREYMDMLNESGGKIFLKSMLSFNGHESYMDSVKKLQSKLTEEIIKISKPDPNNFNVLNHGDCWSNNIMFQYDEMGALKETYFVDYQIPKYGTVIFDLMYFLLTSTELELKLDKFDYLVKYYHDNLIEHLKLLKYPKKYPTLKELHILIHRHGAWAYLTVTNVMAAVLLDPNENASFDNFFAANEEGAIFKTAMYSNARFRKHMEAILPWLYNRGALEC